MSVLVGGVFAAGGYLMAENPGTSSTVSNVAVAQPSPANAGPGAADSLPTLSPAASAPLDPAKVQPTPDGSIPPADPSSKVPPPSSSSGTPAPPVKDTPPIPSSKQAPPPPPPAPVEPTGNGSREGQLVDLVNVERAKAGCEPMTSDSRLAKAAQGHSVDMSQRNYFAHTTPEGVTFDERIKAAGYSRPGAENIAKGSTTASQTMTLWMNSGGHRANILNCDLTRIGVGVTTSGWYWTQDFGY
jgi:uncharacterized protein YkwD